MSQENKAIAKRITEEIWNEGKLELVDEYFAENFTNHNQGPGMPPDREGFKQFVSMYRRAFPDVNLEVQDQIAEGDKVASRFTSQGTHTGELMGIPATGKQVRVTGITIGRFSGGKVVEGWTEFDQAGLLAQLGVLPGPE